MEIGSLDFEKNISADKDILIFKGGILGFEDIKQYELVFSEDDSPFIYLQAVESKHPCFVVCDPISFVPDYKVDYSDEILLELEAESPDDLRCLTIANVSNAITDITINLKAPIVLNIKNSLANQFVMDSPGYAIKHKLFCNDGAVE